MRTIRCPKCKKRIPRTAEVCRRCGSEIDPSLAKAKPKWHERTSVSLCVATVLVVIGLGFVHVIIGVSGPGDLPFDLALRESFGYREFIVNVARIRTLPYVTAKLRYPLGIRVLQAKGYLPTDPSFETRMVYEMREAMNLWYADFEASLGRSGQSWQDRMQQADTGQEQNAQSAEAYNNRAIASVKQGRYDSALTELSAAIRKNPALAEAYYNRALIYRALGNLGQAASDLSRVLEIRPEFADACVNRGRIHVTLERYDDAIVDFTQAIEIDPACIDAYLWRSMIHLAKGDVDDALQDVRTLQDADVPVPAGLLTSLRSRTQSPRP